MQSSLAFFIFLLAVVLSCSPAGAAPVSGGLGDLPTILIPLGESSLQVESLTLTYSVVHADTAAVTARYVVVNSEAQPVHGRFALGWIEGYVTVGTRDLQVTVDGAAIATSSEPASSLLSPDRITAWLSASRETAFRHPMTGKVRAWANPPRGEKLTLDSCTVDFAPNQQREIILTYAQQAGTQMPGPNIIYQWDLLLEPAADWSRFGSVSLQIDLAEPSYVTGSIPIDLVGKDAAATLIESVPADDLLSVWVMPSRGTIPWVVHYRELVIYALGSGAVGMGVLAGWACRRARGARRTACLVAGCLIAPLMLASLPTVIHLLIPVQEYQWWPQDGLYIPLALVGYAVTALSAYFLVPPADAR